jgi:hypothetical protein
MLQAEEEKRSLIAKINAHIAGRGGKTVVNIQITLRMQFISGIILTNKQIPPKIKK